MERIGIPAKLCKNLFDGQWCYYERDSVGEYYAMPDNAVPHLMLDTQKLEDVPLKYNLEGDTIRLYRCGYYPRENPKYSLIAVARKKGFSQRK